jgi:hypothetical protein
VAAEEAADIAKTGVLRTVAKSADGKFLTNTLEAATEWATRMNGEGARVVQVQIPKATAKTLTSLGRIDGIGEAWFATMDQLKNAVVKLLP